MLYAVFQKEVLICILLRKLSIKLLSLGIIISSLLFAEDIPTHKRHSPIDYSEHQILADQCEL